MALGEIQMRKLPVLVAAACTLAVAPALAQSSLQPPMGMNRSLGGSMGNGQGERRTYGEYDSHRHGERGWRGMQEGCKYITVRQRQGDEIIVRHFKRCD
jgi:hypothetical protein